MDNLATSALLADALPLELIQLDQGFEPVWGDWLERSRDFPHPLDWLAERIRNSGFTPGLWLAPFTAHPRSRLATAHPDWLLRNHRGRTVSAGLIGMSFLARALDLTHPGVEDYLRELTRTVVEKWGFSYLKLDFLYAGAVCGRRHNPNLTRAQAYRHGLQIIRETAGADTFILGCGAPLGPSIGLVDAMRIGADTAPYWTPRVAHLGRLFHKDPTMPALRNSLHNVATRAWMQGRWWHNDPDTLLMRDAQTDLSEDEVLSQVTLIGLSGGLYLLSDDLPQLKPERRAIAATLLPVLVEGTDVLDLFRREMPVQIVAPVARPWGNWQLVGLFNWQTAPSEQELPRNLPAFDVTKEYHIVDFWNLKYMRLAPGDPLPKFALAPHGCVLLGVRAVKAGPQLVATTFHITQGGEVADWQAQADAVTLALDIERVADGEVWLALPAPPKSVMLDDAPLPSAAISAVARGVWTLRFRLRRAAQLRVSW